ncbi:flagellar hook-associated protein FlgK [Devosia sp.]|jgi:flagellar hook-associated protein 1 FlgK|uniref:flagellar hook-associated protein FlgK n=1 Tax=Devosia sp. TaxID=1871048 RepID=UPI0037BF3E4B
MGLSVTLSNALSGMRVGQSALDVLSHNVANAGTPGYHRRSVSVIDSLGVNSTYAREGQLQRTFNQALQSHYTRAVSDSGFSSVQAGYLDRVQILFGKPGTTGSLDSAFADFESSLNSLSTSPDNFATRAETVQKAQVLAGTLNRFTSDIQSLRREIESKLATSVDDINSQLQSLEKINGRLIDQGIDPGSRATLMDQRDRLIGSLSEQMDLTVDYRTDGTVALMTRSGVGVLDGKASVFSFASAGALSANSQFNANDALTGVGKLSVTTASGLNIDLVKQNVLRSGELKGLIDLRDNHLVQAQDQLDNIAGALALSMSTQATAGTGVTSGANVGYEVDIGDVQNGNEFTFSFLQGGVQKSVRVVRVDDTSKLPLDYSDANGARVIGLDFSGGTASVASQLQDELGTGLIVTNPSGNVLRITDDGAAGTTDMYSLTKRVTSSALQGGGRALQLFVDLNNSAFTNSLDGVGQMRGFAGRISVNPAVVQDNKLMVQYQLGGSLGDAARVNAIVSNLEDLRFAGGPGSVRNGASSRLAGTVSDFISQAINYQGNAAASAIADNDTQKLTLDALGERLEADYGVDVDEEMARLMELQNAFAANARVMSVAQELIQSLLSSVR